MKADIESDDEGIVAEINMIPLIDVSLVLLIIFMVLTPVLVRSQIKVNLPTASTQPAQKDEPDQLEVEVDAQGNIFLSSMQTSPERLLEELSQRAQANPDVQVVISADKTVTFEHVVTVMDDAKRAGITKVGVAVNTGKSKPKTEKR